MTKRNLIYTHLATALVAALAGSVITAHINPDEEKLKTYDHKIIPDKIEQREHRNTEDTKTEKPIHTGRTIFYLEGSESGISKKTYQDEEGEYVERNNRKIYLQKKGEKRRAGCEKNPKSVQMTGGRYNGKKIPGYVCKDKEGGKYLDINDIPL